MVNPIIGLKKLRASKDNRLPITPSILKGLINCLPHTFTSLFMSKLLNTMYLLALHAFLRVGEITRQLNLNQGMIGINEVDL
jgi:hypothetical protein